MAKPNVCRAILAPTHRPPESEVWTAPTPHSRQIMTHGAKDICRATYHFTSTDKRFIDSWMLSTSLLAFARR